METKDKMHAWVMKPIRFMTKGEEAYILVNSLSLVYTGNTMEEMKISLYISKNSSVFYFPAEGFVPIKKIGNGNEGKDFFIDFPAKSHYPVVTEAYIKKEECLSPVFIEFSIGTQEFFKSKNTDYSEMEFKSLMALIWGIVDGPNYLQQKGIVRRMIDAISPSYKRFLKTCDEEKIEELEDEWKEIITNYQENPGNKGERKKITLEIYELIKTIIDGVKIEREFEIQQVELSCMTDDELKDLQKKAAKEQNFELAANIRDVLKSRIEAV